ncbi:MAG: hypothetical protein OEY89_02215 [Gammaproteobacteria bacterium]|nr:hypothetical protein [Gammaproteobacteria bacterium]
MTRNGLNLQAIFDIHELPDDILLTLKTYYKKLDNYSQLILLGNGGKTLWQALETSSIHSVNPVDDFTVKTIHDFFSTQTEHHKYKIIYPDDTPLGLQRLGELAGWHHPSPFKIGINTQWGSWFAYRAVILSNTCYKVSSTIRENSPCNQCHNKICIKTCPGMAIEEGEFKLERCVTFRKKTNSPCRYQCPSRLSCPVAEEQRYSKEQIRHHYSASMKIIEEHY